MRISIFILVSIFTISAFSQTDTISLRTCYDAVSTKYPSVKQIDYLNMAQELKMKNYNAGYLPTLDLNAQATYQSDVTSLALKLPFPVDMPTPTKDQYKASIDMTEVIYDGGVIAAKKKSEEANYAVQKKSVELELYQVKEKVTLIYFNILFLKQNEKILLLQSNVLKTRLDASKSAVKNGVILESSYNQVMSEYIKFEQQILDIRHQLKSMVAGLNELTGLSLKSDNNFAQPDMQLIANNDMKRIDFEIFDLQSVNIDKNKTVIRNSKRPKLMAFGQLGYGRPGMNMLSDQFDKYYYFGAKLSWNIFDWNQKNRDMQIFDLQKNIIESKKESLTKSINISLKTEEENILRCDDLIIKDKEIIALRSSITKSSSSRFDNGVINSYEYVADINAETQAKMSLNLHEIQRIQAIVNCYILQGKIEEIR